jgi:hypothetical protein
MSSCSSTICWKDFFHWIAFAPLSEISWLYLWVFFRAVYSVLMIYVSILSTMPHYLDCCSITLSLEFREWHYWLYSPSILCLLFRVFCIFIKTEESVLSLFTKETAGILTKIVLKLWIKLRWTNLTILSPSTHQYRVSIHLPRSLIIFHSSFVMFLIVALHVFC